MKKYNYVIGVFLCIVMLTINVTMPVVERKVEAHVDFVFEGYDIIVGVTGHKYESGIRVTEDNMVISGKLFRDIAIGIAVWASNVTIRDCIFINCSDEGIVFFCTSHGSVVDGCIFVECCDGIELQQAHNTTICYCEFTDNWHAGIDAIGKPSYNVSVFECEFSGNMMDIYGLDGGEKI